MPSPVGHALGGIAAGFLVAGRSATPDVAPFHGVVVDDRGRRVPSALAWPAVFAVFGCLADIDFLFGTHSTYTHSVGATLLAGVFAALLLPGRFRLAAAIAAAYGSHVLLDWLGQDTTPPLGVMALWPFSDGYYIAPVPLLMGISRRYWLPGFWRHNLTAVAIELAVLGPLAALAWALGSHRR